MTDALRIDIAGNAKAEATGIEEQLAKVEERAEANREVLKDLQRELRNTKARAADLAKAYQELGDETLRSAAKTAYEEAREAADGLSESIAGVKGQQRSAKAEADRLKDSIKAAASEAKRLEREGAQGAAKALRDAKKEADGLAKSLESRKAKELADEVKRAATEAAELRKHFADVNSLAGRVATHMQDAAVNALQEFVRGIPEGSAAAERHQTVLRNLGAAYQEVQRQTRGTVSAEQAYRVQARLTESGLSLNAQQLGVVTRSARDYARTVGVDVDQALDQLTEGLNAGANEQLRKFGITVQTGHTRTETFTSALRQLEQQQRGNAPAAITAGEAQAQFNTSLTQATQAAQAFLGQRVGLTEFLTEAASLFRELADGTKDWSDVLETAAGTLGEMMGLHGQSANQGTQSNSTAFMTQYAARVRAAQQLGINTRGLPEAGPLAVRTNAQEQQQILASLDGQIRARQTQSRATDAAGRAGMFGGTDLTGVPDLSQGVRTGLSAEISGIFEQATQRGVSAALDARKAEQRRQDALRNQNDREHAAQIAPVDADAVRAARAELERVRGLVLEAGFGRGIGLRGPDPTLRLQGTSDQGVVMERFDPSKRNLQAEQLEVLRQRAAETEARRGENELARLQRLTAATQAYQAAQTEQAQRERQQAEQANELARTRILNAANQAAEERQHETEALAQSAALAQAQHAQAEAANALQDAEQRGVYSSDAVHAQSTQERLRQIASLRTALQALLDETNARIVSMQAEERTQSELNVILQQRIGLQQSLAAAAREQTQVEREQQAGTISYRDAMVGALGSTTDAFASASIAALENGKSYGAAMQEMLRSTLFALAKQSIVETIKNTALGFGALAGFNPGSAGNYFAAAGLWAATGLAAGGVASQIPAASKDAPKSASSSAPPRAAQLSPSERTAGSNGPLNLTINVSGAMFNEGVEDGVVRAIDNAARRGVIPRVVRHAMA